ncbi:HDIG domain-containing metalloprotein [Clostridium sp. BL-8]|uniref:HD family phosphohydrolase n=1 Tax=Clostridium sp. BL-8 TaxID=349938 RepID=UPI00098C503A|nr:HDIG domain-containing metalloprotein [Clostridium sp. BL-8]OOM81590.1 ribonuclease Y [Clostridium sp. BL-8]
MNIGQNNKINNNKLQRVILFVLVFIIGYLLLVTAITPKQYSLKEGDIPRVDIKAPRDTVDEKATKEKEDQALEKVGKQYTLKPEVKKQAEDNIKALFDKLISLSSTANSASGESDKIAELKKLTAFQLTDDQCKVLVNIQADKLSDLEEKITNIVDKVYEKNINENDDAALSEAKNSSMTQIDALNLDVATINALKQLVPTQINPDVFYDEEKTQEKIQEAQKGVSKVIIKQNQTIVKEGEPVTQDQLDILSDLGMLDNQNKTVYIYVYLAVAVFLAIILFLQYNYVKMNYNDIFMNTKKLTLISTINIISLLFARIIGVISPFLIPFACAPMMMTLLFNYKIAIVLSTLNIIIISAVNGFDVQVIILGIVSSILGAALLRRMQQRNELLYSTVYIAVISAILSLSTGILVSSNFSDVLLKGGIAIAGGLLSGVFALGILPFLEGTFNEVTSLKLLELSNPNNPLLKKLLMEAPGTYHHSMLVANLAEMAADVVGANSVITRIGSYFHDVGKIERPYFFGENQMGGDNPHNNIPPNLSTMIIKSHVSDGLELAKRYKLPKVIQDIIAEHHGKTLVKYFYYTMKNSAEDPNEIKESDYMYEGPIPSSKEAAIVMLSDSVEAAVRSIKEPNKEKINEMVNFIIDDKLSSGQLNNCNLTLKDIEKIRECFCTVLNGIYHQRIEYPKEKIKDLNSEKNKAETKE